ncbi:MAG: pilus assembly protein PilM [PVC group bacterium]|nr:pilus assembly protein PilM [PVC group bacterium]
MKLFAGIEIGEQYLKIITADQMGAQPKFTDCIVKRIAGLDDAAITDTIIDVFKKNKYKPTSVALSLPRNFVTVRNLSLPSKDKKELIKMVELHINRIVPYKKEEMFYSYQICGQDERGYSRILVAIVTKEIMRKQMRIIEKTGFPVDSIMFSSEGLYHLILKTSKMKISKEEVYLILDVDTFFTDLIILKGGRLVFSRSISFKNIQLEEKTGRNRLMGDIRQALIIFNSEEQSAKPSQVFLSGAFAEILAPSIEQELEFPVQSVKIPGMDKCLRAKKRTIPKDASVSGVAALFFDNIQRQFSFTLPEIQIRKDLRRRMKELMTIGLGSIYILGVIFFIFLGRQQQNRAYLARLNEQASVIEKQLGEVVHQRKKIKTTKELLAERQIPLFVLFQLQKAVSESVVITNLSIDADNNVVLKGTAQQLSDIFGLTTKLEESKQFKEVETRNTRKRKIKGLELVNFEVKFLAEL